MDLLTAMRFPIHDSVDDSLDQGETDDVELLERYLLVCQATSNSFASGRWRFSIENVAGDLVLEADDEEAGDLNRLTLLAALRGLEAIDGASAVTLLSNNRYVIRSLTDSLPRWRANDFCWDHFGRRIDVQHADLWRRIDRTLRIHQVEACLVSSQIVSSGLTAEAITPPTAKDRRTLRIDDANVHAPARNAAIAQRSRLPGHRPNRNATDHSAGASTDRLRNWLLAGA